MTKFKALPPLEEWEKEFHYDPESGLFTHAYYKCGRALKGSVVTNRDKKGYIRLTFKKLNVYQANRVAWLYVTGKDPGKFIVDHKDGDKVNNCASNLRLATDNTNQWNRKARGWHKHGSGYQSHIRHFGNLHYIGTFSTAEEAQAAYRAKAVELRGEFAPSYD